MNPRLTLWLVCSFAWCCVSGPARAAVGEWVKLGGPLGGLGYNIRFSPTNKNILFVTDAFSGVQRSTNGGLNWQASNTGIDARVGPSGDAIPVFSLTVDENHPNIIWAGTQGIRGVFKSTDGGLTWTRKDTGILENEGLTVRNFAMGRPDTNTVYLSGEVSTGVQGNEFERVKGVVYRTTDGGETWTRIWQGNSLSRWLWAENTTNLIHFTGIFDREAFNIVGEGVVRSTNGGTSWFSSNTGIIGSLFIGGMSLHPGWEQRMVIGTGNYAENNAGTYGGVFVTTDGGSNWTRTLTPQGVGPGDPDNVFTAVAHAPSNPSIVYVGNASSFYRSTDGGQTWARRSGEGIGPTGPPGVRAGVPIEITVDPDDANVVLVNNYGGGVFKSTNGAQSFQVLGKGYTGANLRRVAAGGPTRKQVLANGRSGPFLSVNGGGDWTGLAYDSAAEPAEWYGAAIHPTNNAVLFVTDEHFGKIFASTNSGVNWLAVFTHPLANPGTIAGRQGAKELVFAPSNPNILYAGFAAANFFSEPDSTSFPPSYGIFKSLNGGLTWTVKTNGLGANLNVVALAVDAVNPSLAFAGIRGAGLFKTTDGGDSWTSASGDLPTPDVFALALSPSDPNVLYAGTRTSGVFKSVNGGVNWTQSLSGTLGGGPPTKLILSVVIHPRTNSIVYAADQRSGVYRTTDAGASWQLFNTNLTTRAVNSLAISADGVHLHAGTFGEGVFRLQTEPMPQFFQPPQVQPDRSVRLAFGDHDGAPSLTGEPRIFELQATTNFVTWTTLTNTTGVTNGLLQLTDTASTNQAWRFYRVIER